MRSATCLLSGTEALHSPEIQRIVVFPYCLNAEIGIHDELKPYLSILSKAAIDAATAMARQHEDATLIIPGETPFAGCEGTTNLMAARATDQGIKGDRIAKLYETRDKMKLNNTYLQTQALQQYIGGNTGGLLVLALGYHASRVRRTMMAYGIEPAYMTTIEDVLEASHITDYDEVLPIAGSQKWSERKIWLITGAIGLAKGQIPNFITRTRGARVVDIVKRAHGFELIDDYVEDYIPKLRRETAQKKAA